jgi:UDP-2,4-diacetamido-2,4,6-trideoxy-beta-L-altropyranose hydrolase
VALPLVARPIAAVGRLTNSLILIPLKRRIIIRTEGGAEKGLGHIIRCIALAEMLQQEFGIIFLSNYITPEIEQQLQGVVTDFFGTNTYWNAETEWAQLQQILKPGDILVFDGYCFDTPLQQLVKQAGYTLVCIDDIHAFPFLADAVINHSGGFTASDYHLSPYSKLYTGLEYGLLRKPFREAAGAKKEFPKNSECLICFGGADPANDTVKTLEMLAPDHPEVNFHVVTGNAYRFVSSLDIYKNATNIKFHSNLSAHELCGLMQQCGVAITPPSTTAYEYLSVKGLLYLKVIASNQERMFRYLTGHRIWRELRSFCKY